MSIPGSDGRGGYRGRGRGSNTLKRSTSSRDRGNAFTPNSSDRSAPGLHPARGPAAQYGRQDASQRGSASIRTNFNTHASHQRRGGDSMLGLNTVNSQNKTQPTMEDYKKRLDRIRAARPTQREQFIRQGRMNPDGQMRLSDSVKLIGICTDMCPEFERMRRIVENDVKPPECTPETEHLSRSERVPDESRMVKAYARSAAGMDVELVSEMRSPIACLKTIDYLFDRLDHDEFDYLQNWIWDRTRAVRKDLRTQRIESKSDINILLVCLERTARFHLLSMHHMARSTNYDYAHQQDLEQLNQTMMSLKERYTDNRRASIPSENEAEFWAYRLILAPQYATHQLEDELNRAPNHIKYNMRVQTAVEIYQLLKSVLITRSQSFVQCQANWKKLWELMKSSKVSYLMACAAEVSFDRVRHVVLDCLWRAFRVGNAKRLVVVEDWTIDKLKDVLGLDTDQEVVKLCEAFGFEFGLNDVGKAFLDISRKGYANNVLAKSTEDNPQIFSTSLVESKRHDRALSAIIHGMSVRQARESGWLVDVEANLDPKEGVVHEKSLFIPEALATDSKHIGQLSLDLHGTSSAFTAKDTTESSNSFVRPFEPTSTATPNPFSKAASAIQQAQLAPGFLAPIQHDHSRAHKTLIPSVVSSDVSSSLLSAPVITNSTATNPFLKETSTSSKALLSQPNPFIRAATPTSQLNFSMFTPKVADSLTFSGSGSDDQKSQIVSSSMVSPAHIGSNIQVNTLSDKLANQKTECDKQQTRNDQFDIDTKRQVQEAQQTRALQEAEQQKIQAEMEAKLRRQEQLRRAQEREAKEEEEKEKAREVKERLAQEERRRQILREEARIARMQDMNLAWHSLTADIIFNSDDGLLVQFMENTALNMAQQIMIKEQKEKAEAESHEQRRCLLARTVIAHWLGTIQKRRRVEETRNRRKRIRKQRIQAAELDKKAVNDNSDALNSAKRQPQPNGSSSVVQHIATAAARHVQNTQDCRKDQPAQTEKDAEVRSRSPCLRHNKTTPDTRVRYPDKSDAEEFDFSVTRHQSNLPIDRTQTDWFNLRALGVDPSKQRKRSFDSSSEPEVEPLIEQKRARLSPSIKDDLESPLPPSTTADNHLARFRAIQQAFRKSESSSSLLGRNGVSLDGTKSLGASETTSKPPAPKLGTDFGQSIIGLQSTDSRSSNSLKSSQFIITKARELMAGTFTAQFSSPNIQHDWNRSVSCLEYGVNSEEAGKSPGILNESRRPAYWGRASRFVPRHLYGKGAEAVRVYNDQYAEKLPSENLRVSSSRSLMQFLQSATLPQSQDYRPNSLQDRFSEDEAVSSIDAADGEDVEDGAMLDGPHVGHQSYHQQYEQMHDYGNQSTSTTSAEEDSNSISEEGYALASHRENNSNSIPSYEQSYIYGEQAERYEDYEEYSEDEEQTEDGFLQPQYAPQFGQSVSQQSIKQLETQPSFVHGGNTEDDAIELSD